MIRVDYRGLVPGLVSHRLIFVTGEGGVGKSTVAAALAIASAKSGLRTLLAEISSQAAGPLT